LPLAIFAVSVAINVVNALGAKALVATSTLMLGWFFWVVPTHNTAHDASSYIFDERTQDDYVCTITYHPKSSLDGD